MLLKMNFNKIIKKSTIKNHKRNRLSRISIAENNHMVIRAFKKIKFKPKNVLEIGCSTGYVLEKIRLISKSKCYGIDVSKSAISEGKRLFKRINLSCGFFETSKLSKKKFDVIICGFFLFLLPPNKILNFFSKVNDCVDENGYIMIYDFYNKHFKKKIYKHDKGLFVYRWDYKKLLLTMPNYRMKGYIKNYNKKMKDFEEISILKKIKI